MHPSRESLRRIVEIVEKRPFVLSKELGIRNLRATREHIRLQIEGNIYFSTCDSRQKYTDTEKGYEIRSSQCPNMHACTINRFLTRSITRQLTRRGITLRVNRATFSLISFYSLTKPSEPQLRPTFSKPSFSIQTHYDLCRCHFPFH